MIQDIAPSRLDNSFACRPPQPEDRILYFDNEGKLLVRTEEDGIGFIAGHEAMKTDAVYLFSVDRTGYFMGTRTDVPPYPGSAYKSVRELRSLGGGKELFAAFTAWHLWRWYADNRYCGRCGSPNRRHGTERALQCGCCGAVVYPRINPAVIVGVIREDCLLITRYRTGYAHNALVAGFAEIGETLEETAAREVMEEAGIRVRNIRYYKSQPWGMAQDLLVGFFCEADGDGKIRMDENELKYAEWIRREELVLQPNDLSLTNDMMKCFKNRGEKKYFSRD